jgi:glycosyltransferase involved in cell wall biosynthesis
MARPVRQRLGLGKTRRQAVVRLAAPQPNGGRVLMSVNLRGFLNPDGEDVKAHSTRARHVQMAHDWLELGYDVDVIDWRNATFEPSTRYDVFVDVGENMARLAPLLGPDCIKLLHGMWTHFLFHNTAVYQRHLELQQRRGVTIAPKRIYHVDQYTELSDYLLLMGNDFTASTYAYAGKPTFSLPIFPQAIYPWDEQRDFEASRRNYLWLGGQGLVYKGLDLVLEAFAGMPDYTLTICGPLQDEPDFLAAYHKELFETPNIRAVGWVDVTSEAFVALARDCVGLVYASASEAGACSPGNGMHAGLIPILSLETGHDVPEGTGFTLRENTVAEIQKAVRALSALPTDELRARSYATWQYMQRDHTRDAFIRRHRQVIRTILSETRALSLAERGADAPAPPAPGTESGVALCKDGEDAPPVSGHRTAA